VSLGKKPPPLPPHRWARFRRLLSFYLECVQEDHQQEVRFQRDSRRKEYVPLGLPKEWNLLEGAEAQPRFPLAAADLLSKTRLKGQSAQFFCGYPLLASWEPHEAGDEPSCHLLPLFTQPVELASNGSLYQRGERTLRLTPDWPRVNREALRRLFGSTEEQNEVLEHLGILDWSPELPAVRIGDVVRKLLELKLPIPVIEPLEPENLVSGNYTGEGETGLLNRAILYTAEPSRYTAGLERELRELVKVSDHQLDGTALAPLFAEGWVAPPPPQEPRGVIEVRGLNGEQRRACEAALNAPLTVVTGPPGTGKSQVVINVVANGFLQGTPVVFSSRNRKAVTVVEDRLNSIADAPILFRLGSQEGLAARLSNVLTQLLASGSRPEAGALLKAKREEYAAAVARRSDLGRRIELVRVARNTVDQLDRALEPWRTRLSRDEYAQLGGTPPADVPALEDAVRLLASHAPSSPTKRDGLLSAIRRSFDVKRAGRTLDAASRVLPVLGLVPSRAADASFLDRWLDYATRAIDLAKASMAVRQYRASLDSLLSLPPVDELALDMSHARLEVWRIGREVLELHRSQLGSNLTSHTRTAAAEFLAVARSLIGQDPGSKDAWRPRRQMQELLPRVTPFLPAWAVTNLSAPGAISFHAGIFEVAVIDEASQCDIPSAIPLLYRSKRAVIIGDPQQLRHITTLPQGRESQLAAKHKLTETADQPFTFVNNSLFDVAAASASAGMFALRDHYRSHGDIVGFANTHWYGKDLRILTDYCGLKTPDGEPAGIKWLQVKSEIFRPSGGGAIAPEEASLVVEDVVALLARPEFKGSVGVVSPFRAQANRIREGLYKRLSPEAIERVELVADTAHGFQGDERDLIVFSPCVGAPMPSGSRRFLAKTANLFNVAVTRARAQLRVIGDLAACEVSGIPHVEAFAQHYRRLQAEAARPADDSIGFYEKPLEEALRAAGITAIPQYVFGRYRLDLAVVEGEVKIDIEVDGEHFHKDWTGERCWEDLNRDHYLTQRGWRVLRFWAVEVRDHPARCVERVVKVLSSLRNRVSDGAERAVRVRSATTL
jgi:very-short-patch-repair endonuclease